MQHLDEFRIWKLEFGMRIPNSEFLLPNLSIATQSRLVQRIGLP